MDNRESAPARPPIAGASILVTGGAGFIGSHLVDALFERGAAKVVVIDNLFTGARENLAQLSGQNLHFYADDAESDRILDAIFREHPIDIVFNCATKALNYSFINPADAFATNVTVVLNLLEHQRKGRFQTLIHFSSSEVYGSAVYEPMDEAHPMNATTTYAAGKAAADQAVSSYVHMFGVDAAIVRPFNNYGPRQNHLPPLAGVIPLTAKRIFDGQAPEIHGDGKQSRDFIYVGDTVNAVLALYTVLGRGGAVNISTDQQISIGELIERIAEAMEYRGEIRRMPARGADVFCHNASNAKLRSLIDFPITPIEAGLRQTLDYYQAKFSAIKAN